MPPVWYWRSLLCLLKGSELRPVNCPDPAHFDIAAHNPINVGGPGTQRDQPVRRLDADIGRLTEIVRRAVRAQTVRPARPKPFWSTEIWWDSKPPDPDGVPAHRHARFVTKSIYRLWKQGVSAVIWWYIRDQSHATGFDGTQQSGLFFRDGRAEAGLPGLPLSVHRGPRQGRAVFVWGKAPRRDGWRSRRQTGGGWSTIAPCQRRAQRDLRRAAERDRAASRSGPARATQTSLPWQAR